MARLAIIPARSGSKRIPDKNIRDFFGKPVIAYSIAAAQQSGLFDAIHVSTDDDAIAAIAAKFGVRPDFARPAALAGDDAPLRDVLRFVRDRYGEMGRSFGCICRLSACSPLIEAGDLADAMKLFEAHDGKRSVTAVGRMPAPVERAFAMSKTGVLEPLNAERMFARSQDLDAAYYDSGSFALLVPAHLDREGADFYRERLGYVLPPEKAVDIDEPEDWRLAERLYAGRKSAGH